MLRRIVGALNRRVCIRLIAAAMMAGFYVSCIDGRKAGEMSGQRRQRSLSERIGPDYGWIGGQFVLLALAAVAGPFEARVLRRRRTRCVRVASASLGLIAIASGLLVAQQAGEDLGDSLRVAPTPLDDAELVEHGWYGRVRHPLYLAVLLALLGWSLIWSSVLSMAATLVGFIFFTFKARHEERLLSARYSEYAGYMRQVRFRFIPKIW